MRKGRAWIQRSASAGTTPPLLSSKPVDRRSCKTQCLFKLMSIEGADGDEAAVDVQRWDFSLAMVGFHDDFRCARRGLDIDLFEADAFLGQEHLGHAAITAPARGIHLDCGHDFIPPRLARRVGETPSDGQSVPLLLRTGGHPSETSPQ